MDAAKKDAARQVMRDLEVTGKWMDALDDDAPEWVVAYQRKQLEAFRAADIDLALSGMHPEVEISEPADIPGASAYEGHDGYVEALLDWPRQWEDFQVDPIRVYAPDERRILMQAIHSGRARQAGIEVEAEIVWLFTFEDGLVRRWEMFMGMDKALRSMGDGGSWLESPAPQGTVRRWSHG